MCGPPWWKFYLCGWYSKEWENCPQRLQQGAGVGGRGGWDGGTGSGGSGGRGNGGAGGGNPKTQDDDHDDWAKPA